MRSSRPDHSNGAVKDADCSDESGSAKENVRDRLIEEEVVEAGQVSNV